MNADDEQADTNSALQIATAKGALSWFGSWRVLELTASDADTKQRRELAAANQGRSEVLQLLPHGFGVTGHDVRTSDDSALTLDQCLTGRACDASAGCRTPRSAGRSAKILYGHIKRVHDMMKTLTADEIAVML